MSRPRPTIRTDAKPVPFWRRPGDIAAYPLRGDALLTIAVLTAFGSTRRPGGNVAGDAQLRALMDAETEFICLVGKSWDYHVTDALQVDLDEGLRMVGESVDFLRSHGRRVFFDAEHFFDGYRANPDYAVAVLRAAHEAGAERLVLCDTNGGSLPHQTVEVIQKDIGVLRNPVRRARA